MRGFFNVLSDVRTSPMAIVHELMRQHPETQEFFIQLTVMYLASMARQKVYANDVAHIVAWSRKAIEALDNKEAHRVP